MNRIVITLADAKNGGIDIQLTTENTASETDTEKKALDLLFKEIDMILENMQTISKTPKEYHE